MILSMLHIFGPIRVQSFRILSELNQEVKTYCLLKRKKLQIVCTSIYYCVKEIFSD